ncbi:lysylphosphatidylglycerol synthase transmembrane domain-containing protein [soil metagenome]
MDLSEALRTLGEVNPALLASATLVFLCGYPIRALRWRRILRVQKHLSLRQTLVPVFVGYMANNLLPARAGELYRAHFLGRRARMSRSGAAASIVVERAFDGLMLVSLILLVSVLFPGEGFLSAAAFITGLAFLGLAVGIFLYVLLADSSHGAVDRAIGLLPGRLERVVGERLKLFLRGMRGVSTLGGALEVGAYTVVIWAVEITAYTLAVLAFGVTLPLAGHLLVYTLAALGTALPSGPAYVGPYQYAFVLALGVFAISRETALAVSVGTQIALLGSVTVIGLFLLWREQLRAGPLPKSDESREKTVV